MFTISEDFIHTKPGEKKLTGYKTKDFNERSAVHQFRLLNENGAVYFEGLSDDYHSFQPLDTFGGYFGCTTIAYRSDDKWISLD